METGKVDAPFGFTWGQSEEDVADLGVYLAPAAGGAARESAGLSFVRRIAEDAPAPVSFARNFAHRYALDFYAGKGLQCALVKSAGAAHDALKPEFQSLEISLWREYGRPGRSYRSARAEKIVWRRDKGKGGLINLSLIAGESGGSRITLLYASAAVMTLRDKHFARQKEAEKAAREAKKAEREAKKAEREAERKAAREEQWPAFEEEEETAADDDNPFY